MRPFILITILVFGLLVVGALAVAIVVKQKSQSGLDPVMQEMHPKGYWIGIGIGIFCTYQGVVNAMRVLAEKPIHYALSIPFVK
jgi:hypothetical protein